MNVVTSVVVTRYQLTKLMAKHILITGGAGYIGSVLIADLLEQGYKVSVLDDLWFGGDSILPFLQFENCSFIKSDICQFDGLSDLMIGIDCVVHLAAIVGFPACEKAGREYVWQINVEGTKIVYEAAVKAGVSRMIFTSSYSNYGESKHGEPVTEESPLYAKSIYAESKIEAERFLLSQTNPNSTAPICLRLATVFGLSPRTRFDLIINQFVLDAYIKGKLKIYQEDFNRSFVHIRDVTRAMIQMMNVPLVKISNQVLNLGSENLNLSKKKLVQLIQNYIPQLKVEFLDTEFRGDMRSIHVSFEKIRKLLQFEAKISIEEGIQELLWALNSGMISDPKNKNYHNHPPILV